MLSVIDKFRTQIATAANKYRLAKLRRETAEDTLVIERENLAGIKREIQRLLPPTIAAAWQKAELALRLEEDELKQAKKDEETQKAELVSVVREAAEETNALGRELHPSVNIALTDEVRLPHDLGPFVSWLIQQGRREDISIKIYKLDFYRMHRDNGTLPDGVELEVVPLIRVDNDFE